MRNPIRRNKNIGTVKQGYRKQNRFVIPESWHSDLQYFEKMDKYNSVSKIVNEKEYHFVIENTRSNCCHACTVDDLIKMISFIPIDSLKDLSLIILRQPKKKEDTLFPVWGRLRYYHEIDAYSGSAIILEAVDFTKKLKRSKRLSPEGQKEFQRLKKDGYKFIESKRDFIAAYDIETVRATHLYRTFLHEIGHYKQYLECVKNPLDELEVKIKELEIIIDWDNDNECPKFHQWEKLTNEHNKLYTQVWAKYDQITDQDKEKYAWRCADQMRHDLEIKKLIPFKRIYDPVSIEKDGLRKEDFEYNCQK